MSITLDIKHILLLTDIIHRIEILLYVIKARPFGFFNPRIPIPQRDFRVIMLLPVFFKLLN